jgi:hypothetical protein
MLIILVALDMSHASADPFHLEETFKQARDTLTGYEHMAHILDCGPDCCGGPWIPLSPEILLQKQELLRNVTLAIIEQMNQDL